MKLILLHLPRSIRPRYCWILFLAILCSIFFWLRFLSSSSAPSSSASDSSSSIAAITVSPFVSSIVSTIISAAIIFLRFIAIIITNFFFLFCYSVFFFFKKEETICNLIYSTVSTYRNNFLNPFFKNLVAIVVPSPAFLVNATSGF